MLCMFVPPFRPKLPHTISGIVKDRASVPISGVNIRVEGTEMESLHRKRREVYIGNSSKLHHHLFLCWL